MCQNPEGRRPSVSVRFRTVTFGFCVGVLGRTDKKRTEAQTDQTVLCPVSGCTTEGRTRTSESPPVTGVKSR